MIFHFHLGLQNPSSERLEYQQMEAEEGWLQKHQLAKRKIWEIILSLRKMFFSEAWYKFTNIWAPMQCLGRCGDREIRMYL